MMINSEWCKSDPNLFLLDDERGQKISLGPKTIYDIGK